MKRYESMSKEEILSVYEVETDNTFINIESISKEDIIHHIKNEILFFMHRHLYCDKIPFDKCCKIKGNCQECLINYLTEDIEVKENENEKN